jgi:hypothetical protein
MGYINCWLIYPHKNVGQNHNLKIVVEYYISGKDRHKPIWPVKNVIDGIRVILAAIRLRTTYLLVCCLET